MMNLEGKRICVTGGAGCIGSFVVDELLDQGVSEVVVLDNFSKGRPSNLSDALLSKRVHIIEGDIRDPDLVDRAIKGMDYCFHLASLKIIQCMAEPHEALDVNVKGTFNVLESCVRHHIGKIIFSSTASIYGQADYFPTLETHHPYNNKTFYGALKMANEMMLRSYQSMHGLNFNILRYFNVYGPRMDACGKYTEVLIRWYQMIRQGQQPLIFGDGQQTMDFIYVKDVACATLKALTSNVSNEVFNCASGEETSLSRLCESLLKVMGSDLKAKYLTMPQDRNKIEVHRRWADVSKAADLLDFKMSVSLEQGLRNLVDWLNANEGVTA